MNVTQTIAELSAPALDKLIRKAERHLGRVDPVMQRLIEEHGHCPLAQRELQPFHMLANSIISQQLSVKAARSNQATPHASDRGAVPPGKVSGIPAEQLCGAGLSRAKVRYIGALAERVCARQLVFDEITSKNDEAVIEMLKRMSLRHRPLDCRDVFDLWFEAARRPAVGDAGLQRAARLLYGKQRKSKTLLPRVAEALRPYRSVASWYLWRSLAGD